MDAEARHLMRRFDDGWGRGNGSIYNTLKNNLTDAVDVLGLYKYGTSGTIECEAGDRTQIDAGFKAVRDVIDTFDTDEKRTKLACCIKSAYRQRYETLETMPAGFTVGGIRNGLRKLKEHTTEEGAGTGPRASRPVVYCPKSATSVPRTIWQVCSGEIASTVGSRVYMCPPCFNGGASAIGGMGAVALHETLHATFGMRGGGDITGILDELLLVAVTQCFDQSYGGYSRYGSLETFKAHVEELKELERHQATKEAFEEWLESKNITIEVEWGSQ